MKRVVALLFALLALPVLSGAVQAQESYRVKPGDVLKVEVLEDSSINRDVLVLPDGRISVPLAGTVQAGGQTLNQIQQNVTTALGPNFASTPTVFVSLARLSEPTRTIASGKPSIEVYVLGEVNQPGKYEVDRGTTMLQLLAEIGGLSKFAAKKRIQLHRVDKSGNQQVYTLNYKDVQKGNIGIGMTVMAPGDVIIVPERRLFE